MLWLLVILCYGYVMLCYVLVIGVDVMELIYMLLLVLMFSFIVLTLQYCYWIRTI